MTTRSLSRYVVCLALLQGCATTPPPQQRVLPEALGAYTRVRDTVSHVPERLQANLRNAKETLEARSISDDEILFAIVGDDERFVFLESLSIKTANEKDREFKTHRFRYIWAGLYLLRWERALNGINTPFEVVWPERHAIVALKRRVGKKREHIAYVPYTPHVDTRETRACGFEYLDALLEKAGKMLQEEQVVSRSFPGFGVWEIAPKGLALKLAIIEHIDHSRFKSEPIEQLVNEVLVIGCTNRERAYVAASSSAGAYGFFQFIRSTYLHMVRIYPKAALIPDFESGMRDHVNAAKASMLLFDSDLAQLPLPERFKVLTNRAYLFEYLAVMYNSGRGARLIREHKEKWKTKVPEETKVYLQKLHRVMEILASS